MAWDENLVEFVDSRTNTLVFSYLEEEYESARGHVSVSIERDVYVEDSRSFAVTFDSQSDEGILSVPVAETGVYDENGRLLLHIKHD